MKIGILGATGAVGRQMLVCIEERKLPVDEVRVFASQRSVGKKIPFAGKELSVELVSQERLNGLDFVLGAVSNALSKEYRPMIEKAGAVYVDNSSAFRMEEGVPLVVPEINGEDARMAKQMIFTARNIKADEAYRIGLVNAVVAADQLMITAEKIASQIAKNAPIAVANAKAAINEGLEVPMEEAEQIEEKKFGDCFATHDQKEGMSAFLEKRKEKNFINQ